MASQVPPKRGSAYTFEMALVSQDDTDIFKTSVTLAAGDVQVSKDGGAFGNIATLPTEIGTDGVITVALSGTEMTADRVAVLFNDAAGDEWQDALVILNTVTTSQIDDLSTVTTAQVNAEVDTALADIHLDHVIKTTAGAEEPADGTYLDQIMHKDSNQTFSAATDSLEALRDHIGPTATVTVVAGVSGDAITVVPYTTWEFTISGMADLSGAVAGTGVLFTVKDTHESADTAALLQVRETTGLICLNGSTTVTANKASLTVAGGETAITVHVNASQTGLPAGTYVWDVKQVITTVEDSDQMATGVFTVSEAGITRENTAS